MFLLIRVALTEILRATNKQMPYGLTAFQVNTWLQKKRVLTQYILSPWLEFTYNTTKKAKQQRQSVCLLLPKLRPWKWHASCT